MKKRDLFVFAGQSNMMGASVFPPKKPITVTDSYEYKHVSKRLGAAEGRFVLAGYPCGEFSYTEEMIKAAYRPEFVDHTGKSTVNTYSKTTYFCPAMCNLKCQESHEEYRFDHFSESTMMAGCSMAPLFATEWEKRGQKCAYAHIAKGGVSIVHYFNKDMVEHYNKTVEKHNACHNSDWKTINSSPMRNGASAYFDEKVTDFFSDAKKHFEGEDTSVKALVWCQGESDRAISCEEYKLRLEILWSHMKTLGFTHFFCVRVGFWGDKLPNNIYEIMRAQEDFCRESENCYIVTRAMSLMSHQTTDGTDWFAIQPSEEYCECRDSYFGFSNSHINEKGFSLIAQRMADNLVRILKEEKEPILEPENVNKLI